MRQSEIHGESFHLNPGLSKVHSIDFRGGFRTDLTARSFMTCFFTLDCGADSSFVELRDLLCLLSRKRRKYVVLVCVVF